MPGGDKHHADQALIVALASGMTYEQAAEHAGCSARTVARRMEDAGFRQQIADTKAATVQRVAALLTAASTAAVTTLMKLLNARSEAVRLGAARSVIELAVKTREAQELEARISAIEALLTQQEGTRRWVS